MPLGRGILRSYPRATPECNLVAVSLSGTVALFDVSRAPCTLHLWALAIVHTFSSLPGSACALELRAAAPGRQDRAADTGGDRKMEEPYPHLTITGPLEMHRCIRTADSNFCCSTAAGTASAERGKHCKMNEDQRLSGEFLFQLLRGGHGSESPLGVR